MMFRNIIKRIKRRHHVKASLDKCDLISDLEEVTDSASLISAARPFQSRGALVEKARSPLVLNRDLGTVRRASPADLRL